MDQTSKHNQKQFWLQDIFPDSPTTSFFAGQGLTLQSSLTAAKLDQLPVIQMEQVHMAEFKVVGETESTTIAGVDAVLTTVPHLVLTVRAADCLPIGLYHPSGVIGVVHAGRKGTQLQLLKKVLKYLKEERKVDSDLQLWFGPGICDDCYQINRELDLHYNLLEKNLMQVKAVFPPSQVQIRTSSLCTCHDQELLHSYRREGNLAGRNYLHLCLN